MKVQIIRLDESSLHKDKRNELKLYLLEQFRRAEAARQEQVDDKYERWEQNYYGVPAEEIRTVPWYKSSNHVIKLIRIFVDTFVARTLNIIFSTNPLYMVSGYPSEVKEATQLYLNTKAMNEWDHYSLANAKLFRGNKNGTCVTKTNWLEEDEIDVMPGENGQTQQESNIITFSGPKSKVIPFEDICFFPITANNMEEVEITFHKLRYTEARARELMEGGKWKNLTKDQMNQAFKLPQDAKRQSTQEESGVVDPYLREMHVVECHLRWSLGSKYYNLVGVIAPDIPELIDLYFNPYPRNLETFTIYRPFPKEDFIYGESMCELLAQCQEEGSTIHNDRRNNAFIANAPVFKRRSGSLLPNPSTNWYPGKVFDLEDMADFELVQVGRNFENTLAEEAAVIQYAERLSGIGDIMQGMGSGQMGKKGMYNTGGTLAVLSEGNQRQDTNIRDFRNVLGRIGRVSFALQAFYGKDDPSIDTYPEEIGAQIRQALAATTPARLTNSTFKVNASSAGVNNEVSRANLLQMASILGQYGNTIQQMATSLVDPKLNPSLRLIMMDTLNMHAWMAKTLLRAWDQFDAEGVLPNVKAAIEQSVPGGGRSTKDSGEQGGQGGMAPGGSQQAGATLDRAGLQSILALPSTVGANGGAGNMGPQM